MSLWKKKGQKPECWLKQRVLSTTLSNPEFTVLMKQTVVCKNKEAPKRSKVIEASETEQDNKTFLWHREVKKRFEKDNELEKRVEELLRTLRRREVMKENTVQKFKVK